MTHNAVDEVCDGSNREKAETPIDTFRQRQPQPGFSSSSLRTASARSVLDVAASLRDNSEVIVEWRRLDLASSSVDTKRIKMILSENNNHTDKMKTITQACVGCDSSGTLNQDHQRNTTSINPTKTKRHLMKAEITLTDSSRRKQSRGLLHGTGQQAFVLGALLHAVHPIL